MRLHFVFTTLICFSLAGYQQGGGYIGLMISQSDFLIRLIPPDRWFFGNG